MLSVTQAAEILGTTRQAVGQLIRRGRLRATRLNHGRRTDWVIDPADLRRIRYGRPGRPRKDAAG